MCVGAYVLSADHLLPSPHVPSTSSLCWLGTCPVWQALLGQHRAVVPGLSFSDLQVFSRGSGLHHITQGLLRDLAGCFTVWGSPACCAVQRAPHLMLWSCPSWASAPPYPPLLSGAPGLFHSLSPSCSSLSLLLLVQMACHNHSKCFCSQRFLTASLHLVAPNLPPSYSYPPLHIPHSGSVS